MLSLHRTSKRIAFVFVLSLIFVSCSNHTKKDAEIIGVLNETIVTSSEIVSASTEDYMDAFEQKVKDPASSERAQVWYPRAQQARQLSSETLSYIENIKSKLGSNSNFPSELFEKLTKYKSDILLVDPKINQQFQKSLRVFTKAIDSSGTNQKELFQDYFNNAPKTSKLAMLNKFQNNIRVIENKVIIFCYENVGSTDGDGFATSISAIMILNTSVVKPGGSLEITSGMGHFNTWSKPEVFVNKKLVVMNEGGVAICTLKAPAKPGKYFVPVRIDYFDPEGRKQSFQKELEYTVANIQKL